MPTVVLGELPALPLHTAGKYVAGAYIVLFVLVLIYVSIMAIRLSRIERQLGELLELTEQRPTSRDRASEATPPAESDPLAPPAESDALQAESTPA
jgi:hypothetical protein